MRTLALGLAVVALASAAEIRMPKFTREVLPNGVVLFTMPKPAVPLVSIRVLVKGGVESEPAGLAGIAPVAAQLLRTGTAKRTADRFSAELDGLGG